MKELALTSDLTVSDSQNLCALHHTFQPWVLSFNSFTGFSFFFWRGVVILLFSLLSCAQLFATLWTAAHQASLSFTISQSLLKLMSIEWMMPSNHLILCHLLLLLPSIFPSIRVFSSESALRIRWPQYWSFTFSISPSNECSELISFRMDRVSMWSQVSAFQCSRSQGERSKYE